MSFTQGTHGAVAQNGNVLTYTPAASFTGTDSFTDTISDGRGGTGTATVTVTVDPPPPTNELPSVDAGPGSTVTLPDTATLDGTVTDDGLPSPPSLTTLRSTDSGAGSVVFGNATAVDTTASFTAAGT